MTYIRDPEFNPSDEQRANLAKLADYLAALPEDYDRFDMGVFHEGGGPNEVGVPECGTCACAIGHGLAAGIKALPGEWWGDYRRRAFVSSGDLIGECATSYMFSGLNPDEPHAAATRIREVLAAHEVAPA